MSKLVRQPSFRAADQIHTEWQTFEKRKRKKLYGIQAWVDRRKKEFVFKIRLRVANSESFVEIGKVTSLLGRSKVHVEIVMVRQSRAAVDEETRQ